MLISRFMNFAAVALHHPEEEVKAVLKRSPMTTTSIIGENLTVVVLFELHLRHRTKCQLSDMTLQHWLIQ